MHQLQHCIGMLARFSCPGSVVLLLHYYPWLLPKVVVIVAEGNGQPLPVLLPKVVVVVVVELPALPNIVVAGPPVVPVVSLRVVDGAEVVVPEVVPEVVLRVDVRHEAHEDRADEQPARLKTYLTYSTGRMGWMAHRKWEEIKQQPSMLPGPAVPGSCFASFHFRWAIHPIRPVVFEVSQDTINHPVKNKFLLKFNACRTFLFTAFKVLGTF